jgi:hypothetical protein
MGPVQREAEGREGRRVGAEVARQHYNLSFVAEEIKADNLEKLEGEGRRKEGSPARQPLSKQGSWKSRREMDFKYGENGVTGPTT